MCVQQLTITFPDDVGVVTENSPLESWLLKAVAPAYDRIRI